MKTISQPRLFWMIAFVLFFQSSIAFSYEAPFGLKWGMTEKDLKKIGIKITVRDPTDVIDGKLVELTNVKNIPSDTESIFAIISNSEGVVKIVWVGKTIDSDLTGGTGKKRYFELKSLLTKKYGTPKSDERVGITLYDQPDEFYQCLMYLGCGGYLSLFHPPDGGSVLLRINGVQRGAGYITVGYESAAFAELSEKKKIQEKSKEGSQF